VGKVLKIMDLPKTDDLPKEPDFIMPVYRDFEGPYKSISLSQLAYAISIEISKGMDIVMIQRDDKSIVFRQDIQQ
jgi:hypothetical protein